MYTLFSCITWLNLMFIFLWTAPLCLFLIFSSFTCGTVSLKVFPEDVNFSLYFNFFWRKSLVLHSAWNESAFELSAKYSFQHYCIHFAIWFQSLMKFVGKDVPPLSSLNRRMEGGSLMTTGHIHVKSGPCRMHFKHSCHRWRASQLGIDRSSPNALQ